MLKRLSFVIALMVIVPLLAQQVYSPRPRPESYKNYEDYVEAIVEWKIRQMMPEIIKNAQMEAAVKAAIKNTEPSTPKSYCIPTVQSRIQGEYKGWDGSKVYELQNGQIWKQGVYHYHYHYAYSPEVNIFYTDSGCLMKVDDDDDDGAIVTRIR